MSIPIDAAGADERGRKGGTPKEEMTCQSSLGHTVKNRMTVIRVPDGALSEKSKCFSPALTASAFLRYFS